jgi:hypothetical protein
MRKKGYGFLKNEEKIAKKHDSWEQKSTPIAKNHVFKQNLLKTMDKMMSWGMYAPFLMTSVTLLGIKNTWASKILFFELLAA